MMVPRLVLPILLVAFGVSKFLGPVDSSHVATVSRPALVATAGGRSVRVEVRVVSPARSQRPRYNYTGWLRTEALTQSPSPPPILSLTLSDF